jgi:hypothetical protein
MDEWKEGEVKPEKVNGWEIPSQNYVASDFQPGEESWIKLLNPNKHRGFFFEPGSADPQCNASGCGKKPHAPVESRPEKICYICGFGITEGGNSGTSSITPCLSKNANPMLPLDGFTDGDDEDYKAFWEKHYVDYSGSKRGTKKKKLEEYKGEDGKGGIKKCGKGPGTKYATRACDQNPKAPKNKCKEKRLFRKNVKATPCGSQCEHILPIITLAFVCGLNLPHFNDSINKVFSDCNNSKLKLYKDEFYKWRKKLYGNEGLTGDQDANIPETNPGVVYLWAHPYCNQFKDVYPFIDIDFKLKEGKVDLSINVNNLKYILQRLGGYFLNDVDKGKVLRKLWYDDCITVQGVMNREWYNQRLDSLKTQMNNLKENINNKDLKVFVSICIHAVHIIIKEKVKITAKKNPKAKNLIKLNLCDKINTIFKHAWELLPTKGAYLNGGGLRNEHLNKRRRTSNDDVRSVSDMIKFIKNLNDGNCHTGPINQEINQEIETEKFNYINDIIDNKTEMDLFNTILDNIEESIEIRGGNKRKLEESNEDNISKEDITEFRKELSENTNLQKRLTSDLILSTVFNETEPTHHDEMDVDELVTETNKESREMEVDYQIEGSKLTRMNTPSEKRSVPNRFEQEELPVPINFEQDEQSIPMQRGGSPTNFICDNCERSFNISEQACEPVYERKHIRKLRNRIIEKDIKMDDKCSLKICKECSVSIPWGNDEKYSYDMQSLKDLEDPEDPESIQYIHTFINDSFAYDFEVLNEVSSERGSVSYKKKKKKKTTKQRKKRRLPYNSVKSCKKILSQLKEKLKKMTRKKKHKSKRSKRKKK